MLELPACVICLEALLGVTLASLSSLSSGIMPCVRAVQYFLATHAPKRQYVHYTQYRIVTIPVVSQHFPKVGTAGSRRLLSRLATDLSGSRTMAAYAAGQLHTPQVP